MNEVTVKQIQALALHLAGEAAEVSLACIGQVGTSLKADRSVVTETDFAIQERIVSAIVEEFPDHGIVAEESRPGSATEAEAANAHFTWVIDPLDGTRNYVSGLPCFATSIAVLERGSPIVGVIVEHNVGHTYSAIAGQGALLNGNPVRCEEPPEWADWLIGIPSTKDRVTVEVLRNWIATRGYVCRNLGSTAFHLGLVASSGLTAAFVKRAKIWDLAAGVLIAAEAGAIVTCHSGATMVPFDLRADPNRDLPFLAAPPNVHAALLPSIQAASQGESPSC